VERFEQIRRDHDREDLSIHVLALRHSVHRPLPPPRKRPEGRPAPKLGPYRALIDSWLIADQEAPRKQRHTARRIWQRLVGEHGADVAERTAREYVAQRRRELGLTVGEVFVPLCHEPGAEAEVDWGEAIVSIAGQPTKVYLFLMRACFSGAHRAGARARHPAGVPRGARGRAGALLPRSTLPATSQRELLRLAAGHADHLRVRVADSPDALSERCVGAGMAHPPRVHPHRHSFAVRTLVGWYRDGHDIQARLPWLATYLGHQAPRYTYHYLSAAPELLGHAARLLERDQAVAS
jgi:hypothetical protein